MLKGFEVGMVKANAANFIMVRMINSTSLSYFWYFSAIRAFSGGALQLRPPFVT